MKTLELNKHELKLNAYFIFLVLLACGLPLSKFLMSISQIALLFIWLFQGTIIKGEVNSLKLFFQRLGANIGQKLLVFWNNKAALAVASIYVLHLLGLFYTSDFGYAMKDLRIKLPLFILPIIFSSMPALSKKQVNVLLLIYVLAVFAGTLFSFDKYLRHDFIDPRELSVFIYPIRFCLNIVFAFFVLSYFLFFGKLKLGLNFIVAAFMIWFVYILFIMESMSGLIILFVVGMLTAVFYAIRSIKKTIWRCITLMFVLALLIANGFALYSEVKRQTHAAPVDFATLDTHTSLGNIYTHDTVNLCIEDGYYSGLYICDAELNETWSKLSNLPYYGHTLSGANLRETIIRYLASKGLRKDAEGLTQLSGKEISEIEQGVANNNYVEHPGLKSRLMKIIIEITVYREEYNPNGGSLVQRIEFARASWYQIKQHPVFGIGTGDLPDGFRQAYIDMDSKLKPEYRFRSHNQFVAITVAFGVVGLIWFLISLFYPYLSDKKNRYYLYSIFLFIMVLSMLPEDTIESQDGVTLFAYFNSLLLFAAQKALHNKL